MKIAILGTRGIPNNYGGFEQCAEKLSLYFNNQGHDVTVYSPDDNPYKNEFWNGVEIKIIFCRSKYTKFLSTLIFDYLSLKDAMGKDFDIILELGYAPAGLFYHMNKTNKIIITNMDGLDWKRDKWNWLDRKIIKISEKLAVKYSAMVVADHIKIKNYLYEKFGVSSCFIPYGTETKNCFDQAYAKKIGCELNKYYLLIARIEPENNIEMILDGYLLSKRIYPFVVVGNYKTKYAQYLKNKYINRAQIYFIGSIYNQDNLSSLRRYSTIYFHGHSVGGTNPSLLDAMASRAYIAAHDNEFNRDVLEENGVYFSNSEDIKNIIDSDSQENRSHFEENNLKKINRLYRWDIVGNKYLSLFDKLLNYKGDA